MAYYLWPPGSQSARQCGSSKTQTFPCVATCGCDDVQRVYGEFIVQSVLFAYHTAHMGYGAVVYLPFTEKGQRVTNRQAKKTETYQ